MSGVSDVCINNKFETLQEKPLHSWIGPDRVPAGLRSEPHPPSPPESIGFGEGNWDMMDSTMIFNSLPYDQTYGRKRI